MQVLKETTRNAIITCAEEFFAHKGYESTTMDEIARKASISKGNLYLYFKNKKDLFTAIVPPEIIDVISGLIKKRIKSVIDPSADKTAHEHAGRELIDFLIENRLKFLVMVNPHNSSIIGPIRQKVIDGACDAYESYCKEKSYGKFEPFGKPAFNTLITMLYDNLLTITGQILCPGRCMSEYIFLLQNLFLYHYNGIIAIPDKLSKE